MNRDMIAQRWKMGARRLKREVRALYLAYRDPRTPWYGRVLAALVVAYALSPIDLIPDPIPVLGYLDDLILIPLGVALALRMIPREVMAECRAHAQAEEELGSAGEPGSSRSNCGDLGRGRRAAGGLGRAVLPAVSAPERLPCAKTCGMLVT